MARTANQVKKEKTLEEYNRFAKEVTERVAKSEDACTQKDIARDNNLTPKGLRDLMDYAIITAQVSLETAILVKNKAIRNQQKKAFEAGGSSIIHHRNLIKKREKYLLSGISKAEINEIAEYFANNTSKTISQITEKFHLESDHMTRVILKKAIVENIVTDEVMELMITRSLGNNPSEKTEQVFQMFREERENNKNSH